MIKGVLLDMSGVLYSGNEPLPGAPEAIDQINNAGLPARYITNTTRIPRRQILKKLVDMDFKIKAEQVITAPVAARKYIDQHSLTPFLLIHDKLKEEFCDLESTDFDCVLVGDAEKAFSYDHLNEAFRTLMNGATLIAMGNNRYFRDGEKLSLDAGPFVKALEYASGKEAIVIGKPSRDFFMSAISGMSCNPDEIMMIGDDVEADVLGALNCGFNAALVRTGKYCSGDEEKIKGRAVCVSDLTEAIEFLLNL